jgi:hypothetical protein
LGILFGQIRPKTVGKMWKCLFFLLYKQPKQCHNFCTKSLFILSGRPQLFTIRQNTRDFPLFSVFLSYLDFALCSMNQPQQNVHKTKSACATQFEEWFKVLFGLLFCWLACCQTKTWRKADLRTAAHCYQSSCTKVPQKRICLQKWGGGGNSQMMMS